MLIKKVINLFKIKQQDSAFTLIEVMVAIFIITVSTVGIVGLLQQSISTTSISSAKLIANYLGQEGIEIVRNIRDTNWLEQRDDLGVNWDDDIPVGDFEEDYQSQRLERVYVGTKLNVDASGFYSYSSGVPTNFKRKISITKDTDIIKVIIEVRWQDRGTEYFVAAQENLYRWR
ncbi:MAG: prepilin-type N-terminal cleavage/methylation domain-containing protein [bacterium]